MSATRLLVPGATGMVGQAVMRTAAARGVEAVGAARRRADVELDVTDGDQVRAVVRRERPDVIVNCAALVDHAACEADPGYAYLLNARAVALLSEAAHACGARLVQVSTDQYWTGDGAKKHREDEPVRLLNEYARSKYAAEAFALTAPGALVVRTNVTGLRGEPDRPTFFEWAAAAIRAGDAMQLFDDFFTSTLDSASLAEALLDLVASGARGLLHVASSEVSSKEDFIAAVAERMGVGLPPHTTASVRGLEPPRGESLGLDCSRAESLLGRRLPGLAETVDRLVAAHDAGAAAR